MANLNIAFWINPDGEIYRVSLNHIKDVIRYPNKFGLSLQDIQKVFDKHNEPLGHEGKARDEILLNLFRRNFIRIRKYKNKGYFVNVRKLTDSAKGFLYKWATKLLGVGIEGVKDFATTPVLFDVENSKQDSTTLGEIQKDSMFKESKQYELVECHVSKWKDRKVKKIIEYNLKNKNQIPKDYECCYNCFYMSWMVAIGQGVRCSNTKNQYRIFRPESKKLKLPVIPGVAKKCEHFSNISQELLSM